MGAFSLVRNGLAILASMALLEVVIDELRNKTSSEQQEMKSEQQKSEDETEIEYPPQFKDTVERAKQQKMELETLLNLIDIVAKQIKEMLKKTGKLVEDGEQKSVDVVKATGRTRIKVGIVEENKLLRNWYESLGFVHTGTVKYDFFPFTCGYMEKELGD